MFHRNVTDLNEWEYAFDQHQSLWFLNVNVAIGHFLYDVDVASTMKYCIMHCSTKNSISAMLADVISDMQTDI